MYCENCGSRIPDGAKFCTECGVRIAAKPDGSSVPQDAYAPLRSASEAPAAAAADGYGWSIPGDMPAAAPIRAEAPAVKPLYKRWWFWLILVVGFVLFALLLFAVVLVLSLRNAMPPTGDIPAELEEVLSDTANLTDIDQIPDILESSFGISEPEDAFPLDADDQYTPMDILLDRIDQSLDQTDMEHDVWVDEDNWVFVDLWTEGLDNLAGAAYDGDEASLSLWQELTEDIRTMSGDYLSDLLDGGQHDAVCVVSLLDDVNTSVSLAIAIDGELVLDLATGIDEYGLLED